MNTKRTRLAIAAGVAAAAASTGIAVATASSPASTPATRTSGPASTSGWTPNDCIRLNGGDYTACNVGNSGRGDLVYLPVRSN